MQKREVPDFKIIEFQAQYKDQVIGVIGKGLRGLGIIPESDEPITDEDLYHIPDIYKDKARFWVAISKDRVIGTVAIKDMGGETAKLKRMFVLEKYHGSGVGQALLDHALKFAKKKGFTEVILNTHSLMKRAHRFYEKNSFQKVGEEPNKYHYKLVL